MPKSKKRKTAKNRKNQQQHRIYNCDRDRHILLGDSEAHLILKDPLYLTMREAINGVVRGLQRDEKGDYNSVVWVEDTKFALMYSKQMFVPNRDFVGMSFTRDGKHYGCSWLEMLHPRTVRGGFWVIQEFDQPADEAKMKEFEARVLSVVIPIYRMKNPELFAELDDYNMRLLGIDKLSIEQLVEDFMEQNASIFRDMKFGDENVK